MSRRHSQADGTYVGECGGFVERKIQQELTQKISEICPTEEFIRKSEKEKEDITKEAAMNIVQEAAMSSVWFMTVSYTHLGTEEAEGL